MARAPGNDKPIELRIVFIIHDGTGLGEARVRIRIFGRCHVSLLLAGPTQLPLHQYEDRGSDDVASLFKYLFSLVLRLRGRTSSKMGFFQRIWAMLCAVLARALAILYDRRARAFERGGVAARRRELVATVPAGGSVLEVGAGTGSTLAAGAYAGGPGRFSRIVAIEPDHGMRAVLQKRACGDGDAAARVEVMDARFPNLPFADMQFDAVVCFMVLSHVYQRAEAVKEACRVLKIGGKLLLMDHGVHEHQHGHEHAHVGHAHDTKDQSGHEIRGHKDKRHDLQAGQSGSFFWFREWFQTVFVRGTNFNIGILLDDIKKEDRLKEDFVSRMTTKGYVTELCYGSFTRVE